MSLVNLNSENFTKEVLEEEKPVLIDFWADWCSPCKMMAPILEELAEKIPGASFYKVDVDEDEKLARSFGILSIPTMILFVDGKQVEKHIGLMSKTDLKDMIEKHI